MCSSDLEHLAVRAGVREQLVKIILQEIEVHHDGHHRDVILARGCEYLRVGATRNQTVGIDRVPGGDERIYFVGVGEERADGIGIARHIEERFWLLRARGERCAEYKDAKASQNFHGVRMLCGSLLGDNVSHSQSSQRLLPPLPALAELSRLQR